MLLDSARKSDFVPRVSQQDTLPNFQKVSVFQKMAAILNFRQKHKMDCIFLSIQDRAVSSKLFIPTNAVISFNKSTSEDMFYICLLIIVVWLDKV